MGRIIAIDYGRKRTGIAVSDPLQMIAGGLTTMAGHEVVDFLKKYIKKEKVDLIIVGAPVQMNYQPSENMQYVNIFCKDLKKRVPDIKIKMVDERFTSVLAHKAMIEAGLRKKARQRKELVDEISATLILETFLENKQL